MEKQQSGSESLTSTSADLGAVALALRPGYGTQGEKVDLISNFVEIRKMVIGDIVIKQYCVDFLLDKIRLTRDDKRKIFWQMVKENPTVFGNFDRLAFDGQSIVFSMDELSFGNKLFDYTVELQLSRSNRPVSCRLNIRKAGNVHLAFKNIKKTTNTVETSEQTAIQVVDVVLTQGRSCTLVQTSQNFCLIGNSAYELPRQRAPQLGFGAEIWRGLFLSARVCEGFRPMTNVDISNSAFYRPQSLLEYICDALNGDRKPPMYSVSQIGKNTVLSEAEFRIVGRAVKNLRIRVTHRNTMVVYRIVDIHLKANGTFFIKDEQKISVSDYFRDTYKHLNYPSMPVVQVGRKNTGPLIPVEVCIVAEKQKYNKHLTGGQTTQMIRHCSMDAQTRLEKVRQLVRELNLENDRFIKSFGMSINAALVAVPGRVIPPPKLVYSNRNRPTILEPKDGVWRMQNMEFFKPGRCTNFSAISLLRPNQKGSVIDFCMNLAAYCRTLGMQMPQTPYLVTQVTSMERLEETLRILVGQYEKEKKVCQLLLVALSDPSQYSEIKENCDVKFGIMTQCFMPRVFNDVVFKKSQMTMHNLALKINAKIGGKNSILADDKITKTHFGSKPTLVIGIDVTHPGIGDDVLPSIAAIVGNVDPECMKYEASIRVQPARRETILHLEEQFHERLIAFSKANGGPPHRVYVFRDGVAEGQFMQVLKEELKALRHACRVFDKNRKPKVTFIVVQKRHHTRFAFKDSKLGVGKGRNIPAGTVVDRRITSAEGYDFYLCSHAGIQGTSRPTKYQVIYDDNNLSSDEIESVTYYLCHTFSRCTRSVSIPAPVYYAHLACCRARCHAQTVLAGSEQSFASTMNKSKERSMADVITATTVHKDIRSRMYFT